MSHELLIEHTVLRLMVRQAGGKQHRAFVVLDPEQFHDLVSRLLRKAKSDTAIRKAFRPVLTRSTFGRFAQLVRATALAVHREMTVGSIGPLAVDVETAGAMLVVEATAIVAMIDARELPVALIAGRRRVPVTALRDMLEARTLDASAHPARCDSGAESAVETAQTSR